ncbi:hypothetical protein GCM10023149_29590 [Mucilaginibacter gynuensis]|uniref:Secreted protein n=2 Tax=Mucilaginibacter gynuensis TaxID=1302236 RepID=A0ABP8GM79_9SPHI
MKKSRICFLSCLFILSQFASQSFAQRGKQVDNTKILRSVQKKYGLDPDQPLEKRIEKTPDSVIKMFRDAGMSPTAHILTEEEINIVAAAVAALPPLHRRVLKQHLKSISFLDNMPNTALTAPITNKESAKLYHITFRAGILHQSISDWVTGKERTCFAVGDSTISISIQAGLLSALTYVMLHEGTHVVDGSVGLLSTDTIQGRPVANQFRDKFAKNIWGNFRLPVWQFADSLAAKSIFRPSGRRFALNEAERVYKGLAQMPFVSLYSTASWHEDLAELLTIYHLTKVLHQPFQVVVTKNGRQDYRFEPMSSPAVKHRVEQLERFYRNTN